MKAYRSNGSTRWREGRPHIVDRVLDGGISIIVNTTEGWQSLQDSKSIRRTALTEQRAVLHHGAGELGGGAGDCRVAKGRP